MAYSLIMIQQRKIVGLFLMFLIPAIWAEDEPRFQTTANAADVITPVGGKGVFGLGVYSETIYPLSKPFASDTAGGHEDMRFQVPLGFGIEGSYGITKHMEVALSGGFDYFKTQNFRGVGPGPTPTKIYDEAKYRLFPVVGIFRYRWPMKSFTPEAEVGLGAAFGSIKITAYKNGRESVEQKGPFYRAHLAAGAAFSWGEGASLHLQLGYAVNQLGKKTYIYASDKNTVTQQEYLSGVFTKAYLKFYF
jgi:hypothetical protein